MTHSPNEKIGSFLIEQCGQVPDLGCFVTTARHLENGARVLHIGNQDPENLFCLAFQTPAVNNTGIAHILEHCVLCGSKNYPVRDPFFSMTRRSLNTFMNAFTGGDFTCYPAASQVREDFYNLLSVYLDAVFLPRLSKLSFWQEGIRKELIDQNRLEFKGIVYNEMKGAYASAEKRLWSHLMAQLLPKTSQRYDSGGDPKSIPNLSCSALQRYHNKYYHPSRCLYYFYGNLPLKEHLEFLQKSSIWQIPTPPILQLGKEQKKRRKPTYLTKSYPCDRSSQSHKPLFGISWWTADLTCTADIWICALLDELLLGSEASFFKRQLIEGEICKQVYGCLDAETPHISYTILMKGCESTNSHHLTQAILSNLKSAAEKGFSIDQLTAAIHRLELQHLEIETGSTPYGLALFWRAGLSYQHKADPLLALEVKKQLCELEKLSTNLGRISAHLQRLLIDNLHRSSVVSLPDPDLASIEQNEEKKRISLEEKRLTSPKKLRLERQKSMLFDAQNRVDDLSCLPILPISFIPSTPPQFDLTSRSLGSGKCHFHKAHTNGFIYIDCYIPLPEPIFDANHPQKSVPLSSLWRLFANFLPQMGAADRSFLQNAEEINSHSGGLSADITCFANATGICSYYLHLRIKGTKRKSRKLVKLLSDSLLAPRFEDSGRLSELMAQQSLALEDGLPRDATSYVIHAASCAHSQLASHLRGLWGFGYLSAMRSLNEKLLKDPKGLKDLLIQPLLNLHSSLLAPEHLLVTCEKGDWDHLVTENFFGFGDEFESARKKNAPNRPKLNLSSFHRQSQFAIPAEVASNSLAVPSLNFAHPDQPHLQLLSHLIQQRYLHPKIREQGGAYGSGALCRSDWQSFALFSARDPNILATKEIFSKALIDSGEIACSNDELDEAKRSAIQQQDTPIQPGYRGLAAFNWQMRGQTQNLRKEQRARLLSATPENVRVACQEHLLPHLKSAGFATASNSKHLRREMPDLHLHSL